MAVTETELVARNRTYYRERFREHGATPLGVDWNGADAQRVLFEQLVKLLPADGVPCSLNDFGCGYGALVDFLKPSGRVVTYRGYDLNDEMIDSATRRHAGTPGVAFFVADRPLGPADFGVASGLFSLRHGRDDAQCMADLIDALDALHATSRRGFAFNALTSYSDADRMRADLYYPDPCVVFDLCKRRYARDVALLHDYALYGFTMLVRKP